MRDQKLAHISDLHVGRSPAFDRGLVDLRDALLTAGVDHIVLTGDVTHRGRREEWLKFEAVFAPLLRAGRVTLVPGNHDRLGDDVGHHLMDRRVEESAPEGLYLVKVDSTGPHNRFLLTGHGEICDEVLGEIDDALARAPRDRLVAVLLHHHPLPLPEETLTEKLSSRLGWPCALELRLGLELLERLRGRADLVLHGHRHTPRAVALWTEDERPIGLYNAGCTTELGRLRVFHHAGGTLLAQPHWMQAVEVAAVAPLRLAAGAML